MAAKFGKRLYVLERHASVKCPVGEVLQGVIERGTPRGSVSGLPAIIGHHP